MSVPETGEHDDAPQHEPDSGSLPDLPLVSVHDGVALAGVDGAVDGAVVGLVAEHVDRGVVGTHRPNG